MSWIRIGSLNISMLYLKFTRVIDNKFFVYFYLDQSNNLNQDIDKVKAHEDNYLHHISFHLSNQRLSHSPLHSRKYKIRVTLLEC